jgi:alpha-tubulin suppressor-like RCC1 family protein
VGNNEVGQLGLGGNREQENTPVQVKKGLHSSDKVSMTACGQLHTLILTRSGLVYVCGANSFG